MKKIIIIGAGNGAQVISEIFELHNSGEKKYEIMGYLDDDKGKLNKKIYKNIVCLGELEKVHEYKDLFNSLIISISGNMRVRFQIYQRYEGKFNFINAIHPTAFISPTAQIGKGNIIGANVSIGAFTTIGDNNLISSHTTIEHHNSVGDHNLFGPACSTSGLVSIGDQCTFGAGVHMVDTLNIGNNSFVAAGLPVVHSLKDGSRVKYKEIPWSIR